MAKGFKKRYFSLAAIAATVSVVNLNAQAARVESIEKIVVSAQKIAEDVEDVTDDIEIIDAQELDEKGIRTLPQLLHYITGSSQAANGGVGKVNNIYLRGLSNDKLLILIDGVRFNDPSNFNGPSSEHLLLNNVKRVEIIKGAQSGIWGSDAAAGVVNIITNDKEHTSIDVNYGSFHTVQSALSIVKKHDKIFYGLDFDFYKTDGFSAITPYNKDPRDYEADGYINRNVRAKVGYKDDNLIVESGMNIISAYNQADGYNPTTYAPDPNSRYNDIYRYHAFYTNATKSLHNHTLDLHIDTTTTNREFPDATWGVNSYEGKTGNIELRDTLNYGGTMQFGAGLQRYKSSFAQTTATSGQIDYDDRYIYLTNSNRFDKLILQENIRYDSYDKFDNQVTGKIGAKYNLANLSFFANAGKAYNVPNQIKMINPWGVSNFNLQPEKTTSYDIGVQGYGAKLVYFEERVKDLINWYDPDSNTWGDEYYKNYGGTSKFKGIEASYKRALGNSLYLELGATYLSPKDPGKNPLPRRARHRYNYSLTWYPSSEHTININGYYVGSRYDDAAQTKQTGKYNVVNLSLSHQFAQHFKGYILVHNLFDKRYQEVYGYGSEPQSFYIGIKGTF
ncbi:TonB-dependent siderophore receptor [Nitratiruptor sp. YY09-18]|uniref:TonB-dependent receptor plug domain-containing protein n=1 Tax=Nitratiruptor sp. YY09-18 TaxID=2724901 RepID=UPI0019152367|nr:TonB-dependent receptor [Nitratiruptor sp. YY09-18]BCD68441.1 vitamin B12 transporter [Nitratiruptor sp. YY09-18]